MAKTQSPPAPAETKSVTDAVADMNAVLVPLGRRVDEETLYEKLGLNDPPSPPATPPRFSPEDAFAELLDPGVSATFADLTPQGQEIVRKYADLHYSPIVGAHLREEARATIREHRLSGLFDVKPTKTRPERT